MPIIKALILFASFALLLNGCSALQHTEGQSNTPVSEQQLTRSDTSPPRPAANLEPETLYTLLVAELAGQSKRYDILLSNYLSAAQQTRDPGIAERATQIGASLGAHKATLMAAQLWHDIEPENPQAQQILASQLIQAGQLDSAIKLLEELLARTGDANFEYLTSSSQYLNQNQRNDLLNEFERLLGNYPDNLQLLMAKTILLQLNGRSREALASADILHRLEKSARSLSLKAKLNHQLGNTKQALSDLKRELAKTPDSKPLQILYAQMLIDDKQLLLAQQQYLELSEQLPADAQLRLTLALLQLENGFTKKGNENLTRLLENPAFADEAHYYLGQSAEKSLRFDVAISHYQQILNGSKFLPAYTRLGTLLLEQNNPVKLDKLFSKARQVYPQHSKNLFIIEAGLLTEKNSISAAMTLLNQALKQYPADINLLYSRAMTAEKNNDLHAMENDLRTILSQEPDNAMVLNALGYTLADRTSRYQEALILITRAVELKPDDPAIIDSLGWAQFRLGNYKEAIRLLEQAHSAFPDHEVAAHLGEALWVTGQHQRAREIWSEALQRHPDSAILKRVIDRLNPELSQ